MNPVPPHQPPLAPPPPRPSPPAAAPPSCCAGLFQTVLHGWQDRFPLRSSPFYVMAASSGATPRELLATCERLQRSGALQPIRAHWGPALRRERWRLGFHAAPRATRPQAEPPEKSLAEELLALPGCMRLEHGTDQNGHAQLWVELEALDELRLQHQLDRLSLAPQYRLRLQTVQDTRPGPYDDEALASLVERGLPLSAGPYERCAQLLGRSERQVLAALRNWQRDGQLAHLSLAPTPTRSTRVGVLALWSTAIPGSACLHALQLHQGLQRLLPAEPTPQWPWRFGLVLEAAQTLADHQLNALLAQAGLCEPPDLRVSLRIERPREGALLFGI
ncbi:hypothetical protein [Inhella sp.]|uniref:hypothetical protein n=1 Tax=Inhella sp. TaxID=1921806 RepID=UPI0035AE1A1B